MNAANYYLNSPKLVADIGGTNARIALNTVAGEFSSVRVMQCEKYHNLAEVIRAYLTEIGADIGESQVEHAVVAIATPVLGDQVKFTNNHWQFSIEATRQALGLKSLLVMNDFSALAMSLPYLGETELTRLDNLGQVRHGVKAVIGPGTGLGVAGLVPVAMGWQALATEGGHVSLSPANPLEQEIIKHLWREYPHVSAERLISGPGIVLLYHTLCQTNGVNPAASDAAGVVALATNDNCTTAQQTLSTFSGLLGGVAGNLALTYGCQGGLYLGGGVLSKLGAQFDKVKFCERFVAKGRFKTYLEAIPRYMISAEHPAFIGAAEHLRNHISQGA